MSGEQRARLANPLAAGMAGPILAWLQEHDPAALQDAAVAVQPKDYVRTRLGGPPVGERSDACATLLWDVPADDWARDVVAAVGLPENLLPQIVPSDRVVATAALPGAPALVTGAGDTPAALLGLGGLADGQVQVNVGSGVQILMKADRAASSGTGHPPLRRRCRWLVRDVRDPGRWARAGPCAPVAATGLG